MDLKDYNEYLVMITEKTNKCALTTCFYCTTLNLI